MNTTVAKLACTASFIFLAACGGGGSEPAEPAATEAPAATGAPAATAAATPEPATEAPAADNTDTLDGVTFASVTGDAAKGETVFIQCKSCHVLDAGVNRIGPSLAGIVGRQAGTVADFSYSEANANSGITWSKEKLFQYLENPQRVIPGTKMAFAGLPKAQDRADVIAYLETGGQ